MIAFLPPLCLQSLYEESSVPVFLYTLDNDDDYDLNVVGRLEVGMADVKKVRNFPTKLTVAGANRGLYS